MEENNDNNDLPQKMENLNIKKTKTILVKRKKVVPSIPQSFVSPEPLPQTNGGKFPNFPIDSSLFQMVIYLKFEIFENNLFFCWEIFHHRLQIWLKML